MHAIEERDDHLSTISNPMNEMIKIIAAKRDRRVETTAHEVFIKRTFLFLFLNAFYF